jgi:hypothetical protein
MRTITDRPLFYSKRVAALIAQLEEKGVDGKEIEKIGNECLLQLIGPFQEVTIKLSDGWVETYTRTH